MLNKIYKGLSAIGYGSYVVKSASYKPAVRLACSHSINPVSKEEEELRKKCRELMKKYNSNERELERWRKLALRQRKTSHDLSYWRRKHSKLKQSLKELREENTKLKWSMVLLPKRKQEQLKKEAKSDPQSKCQSNDSPTDVPSVPMIVSSSGAENEPLTTNVQIIHNTPQPPSEKDGIRPRGKSKHRDAQ